MISRRRHIHVFFALLLCVQEAAFLPAGQNGVGDEANKDRASSKTNYQCEYKCASYNRMCEENKNALDASKCNEVCGEWQKICDQQGRCRKQCAFTTIKCDKEMGDMSAPAAVKPMCMAKCTGWDVICAVPDDLSPIVSQTDDGSGGKNPFEPTKCLRTCAQWNSLNKCTRWDCNRLPQVMAEDANGKNIENILAGVECIGSCVTWDKFGTCVQWKCFPMESMSSFQSAMMQRGWWDDFWSGVKEWGPTAISICSLFGLCG